MLSPQNTVIGKAATASPALTRRTARAGAGPVASFSQMLTEQAPATPPAPPPSATPVPTRPDAAPHGEPPAAKANAAPKPANNGTNKAPAQAQNKPKADTPAEAKKAADGKTAAEGDAKPETAGLDEFTSLIGLATPGAAPLDAAAAVAAAQAALQAAAKAPADDKTDAAATAVTDAVERGGDARASRRGGEADLAVDAKSAHADLAEAKDAKDARSADVLQDTKALDAGQAGPHAQAVDAALPTSFAASLQAATANAAPAAATDVTTSANIGAPLHGTAFAPEVAASVSLMAVDGVQHAELQLNPTDMGPVAVQIVVDGSQAQVSFHAAHAETRQALEQSLPDLAAALQGQGLTLSGGGVFQQAPREQRGSGDAGAERGSTSRGGSRNGGTGRVAGTAAPVVRRQVGLVDTFA